MVPLGGSGLALKDYSNAILGAHMAMIQFLKKTNPMEKFKNILQVHGVRPNENRVLVLQLLTESKKAFSLCNLHQLFREKMDRTTVYRILILFTEKDILQKIPCTDGNLLFTLKTSNKEIINSPKFRCKCCQKVEVLPDLPVEYLNTLTGKNINPETIAIEGYCKDCHA
jgi:Fur family ferric uptake transcriptional regulator